MRRVDEMHHDSATRVKALKSQQTQRAVQFLSNGVMYAQECKIMEEQAIDGDRAGSFEQERGDWYRCE